MNVKLARYQSYAVYSDMSTTTTMVIQISIGPVHDLRLDLRVDLSLFQDFATQNLYEEHFDWIREAYGLPTWKDYF